MPFRQRAMLACGILLLLPTAIWAIRGEFFPGENILADGPIVVYGELDWDFSNHEGVDVGALSPYFEEGDHVGHGRAHAHPHGSQVCASGCAASNHPTMPLTKKEFQRLMALFAEQPMSAESEALDHLVYYGRQTLLYLDRIGHEPLDDERATFLRRELKRTHVIVHFRVVDEHGVVRVSLPPTRVPLDIRHEFTMDTQDLQPVITSGTVKRVKLYHIWQRI